MYVAALRIDLRIRDAHSLKEKRHVIKSVSSHIARKYRVAVAEVDYQDLWNRAALGIAATSAQAGHLDRILRSVEVDLRSRLDVEVLGVKVSHMESPG